MPAKPLRRASKIDVLPIWREPKEAGSVPNQLLSSIWTGPQSAYCLCSGFCHTTQALLPCKRKTTCFAEPP